MNHKRLSQFNLFLDRHLDSGLIPDTELKVFQPFMRFEQGEIGILVLRQQVNVLLPAGERRSDPRLDRIRIVFYFCLALSLVSVRP